MPCIVPSVRSAAGGVLQKTAYEYDALNRVLKQRVDPQGLNLTTTTVYDDAHRQLLVTDPLGVTDVTQFDARGRVESVTKDSNGLKLSTRYRYDAEGRLLSSTDANGLVTSYVYDALGRKLTQTVDPGGLNLLTRYSYDRQGHLARIVDPMEQHTRYVYDSSGRLQYTLDPANGLTEHRYDALGNLSATVRYVAKQAGFQTVEHANGLISNSVVSVAATAGGDRTVRFTYDAAGRQTYSVDAAGAVTQYEYDAGGRLVTKKEYANAISLPTEGSEDGQTLVVKGDYAGMYATTYAAIDPGKTYKVRARLRQLSGKGYIYSGVIPKDASGNIFNSNGKYPYPAVSGQLLTPEQGWQTYEGTISGIAAAGVYDNGKFLYGTQSAAALLIYNYAGNEGSTDLGRLVEVDSVELIDLSTGAVVSGGKMAAGASGWALDRSVSGAYGTGRAEALSASQVMERLRPTKADRVTRYAYDAAGRQTYSVDATGAVTQYEYDAAGRLVAKKEYANAIGLPEAGSSDGATAVLSGSYARLINKAFVAIDTSKTYKVRARLRQLSGVGTVYVGVATKDGNGVMQSNPYGGSYSYCAVPGKEITPEMGWVTFEGAITGETAIAAGVPYNRFFSGAKTASPLMLYNYGAATSTDLGRLVEVDSLELIDVATGAVINAGATLAAGAEAWETTGALKAFGGVSATFSADDIRQRLRPGAADRVTRYTYDADGRLAYSVNALGSVSQQRYSAAGSVIEILSFAIPYSGPISTAALDAFYADPAHRANDQDLRTRVIRDALGRERYSIDAQGSVRELRYDGLGRVVRRIDWDQRIDLARLDDRSDDRAVEALLPKTSAQARETVFGYDALDRQVLVLDAEGGLVEQVFDGLGQVAQRIAYDKPATDAAKLAAVRAQPSVAALRSLVQSSPGADRVERRSYDSAGRLTRQVDAEGGVTAYAYDSFGNLTEQLQFAQALSSEQMAGLPPLMTQADLDTVVRSHAADRRTNHRYDAANRLRYSIDAHGGVTEQRYLGLETRTLRYKKLLTDRTALPEATPGEDLVSATFADLAGRLERSVDAAGVVTRYRYNALGQLKEETRAEGRPEASTTRYEFDNAGRMKAKTVAAGTAAAATTGYEYNALGQLVCETEPRGMALATQDSAWAQAERQAQGLPALAGALAADQQAALIAKYSARHGYDRAGRRTSTTNAAGAITSTRYDAFGRASVVVDPLGNTGYFYYDKLGRVTLQVDPEGYATRTSYTVADGQVASVRRYFNKVSASEGVAPATTDHARDTYKVNDYDRLGRLTRSTDNAGAESTQYGVGGNRFSKRVLNKLGAQADFAYDKLGRVVDEAVQTTAGQPQVHSSYAYDAFGNRISVTEAAGTAIARTTTYRHDELGRVTHRIGTAYAAHAADGGSRMVTPVDFTRYDALGRTIETITHGEWAGGVASGPQRSLSYYDAAGNKVAQLQADGALTSYAYDPAGHLVLESAWAGKISLPPMAGGAVPSSAATPGSDRITRYSYDEVGRQVKVERAGVQYWEPAWNGAGTDLVQDVASAPWLTLQRHVYDAAGRLVQEIDGRGHSIHHYYDSLGRKTLRIDQESYGVAWDYDSFHDTATTETKYAGKISSYARQDDAGVAASLRSPAALRAGLSLLDARITRFELDAAGRVAQRELLNVESVYTDADGTQRRRTDSAITRFSYDALGHVTELLQRASVSAAGEDVWLQTSMRYDQLGRLVKRLDAAYKDDTGATVRPVTDTVYDELGQVTRVIRRGSNEASEADDRITRYGYDANGVQTSVTDASDRETRYAIDAAGHVAISTVVSGQKTLGGWADIVKRYSYDACGRVVAEQDQGTGEIRRTRYNAFGDISAKGLGDGWQEFIEYNALGKIQRNNTDTGGTRLYLYDRNGNTTREIQSNLGVDLQALSVADAAVRMDLDNRYSVYDKRNQLLRTADINKSEYTIDQPEAIQKVYTQKLADLYGALGLANTTGAPASGSQTDVSVGTGSVGAGGSGGLANALNDPRVKPETGSRIHLLDGKGVSSVSSLGGSPLVNVSPAISTPGTVVWTKHLKNGAKTWNYSFWLPRPAGSSSSLEIWNSSGTVQYGSAHTTEETAFIYGSASNTEVGSSSTQTFVIKYREQGGDLIEVGQITATSTCTAFNDDAGQYISTTSYSTKFSYSPSGVIRLDSPVGGYYRYTFSDASGVLESGTATSAKLIPVNRAGSFVVTKYDADGRLLGGGVASVSSGGGVSWADIPYMANGGMRFNPDAVSAGFVSGTVYHRVAGSLSNWVAADVASVVLAPNEEFILEGVIAGKSARYYGRAGGTAVAEFEMLPQSIEFGAAADVEAKNLASRYPGSKLQLVVLVDGKSKVIDIDLSGPTSCSLNESDLNELVSNSWTYNKEVSFTANLNLLANGVQIKLSSQSGTLRLGADPARINLSTPTRFNLPLGSISTPLPGPLTVGGVTLTSSDARRWSSGGITTINFAQWVPSSGSAVLDIAYDDGSVKLKGTATVSASGVVSMSISQNIGIDGTVSLSVPGAISFDTVTFSPISGAGPFAPELVAITPAASSDALGKISWRIKPTDIPGSGSNVYLAKFQTRDSTGRLMYVGSVKLILQAGGSISWSEMTYELRPSYLDLSPPAGTTRMEVHVAPEGSEVFSPLTAATSAALGAGKFRVDVGASTLIGGAPMRPTSGMATYRYTFVGRDANGRISTRGTGSFTVDKAGAMVMGVQAIDRQPQPPLVLSGPVGNKDAALLKLVLSKDASIRHSVTLKGVWNTGQNRMDYTWLEPLDGVTLTSESRYDFDMQVLDSAGAALLDAVSSPIKYTGVMVFGAATDQPVKVQVKVTELKASALVQRAQTYNAFGEIVEEYDDGVADRAKAMVAYYKTLGLGSFDAPVDGLRSQMRYSTAGQMLTKTDAWAFETLENGFVRRARPVTQFGYDLLGRLTSVEDANHHISGQSYGGSGASGRASDTFAADGGHRSLRFNLFGEAARSFDELGHEVQSEYNKLGQLVLTRRLGISRVENFGSADGDLAGYAVSSTLVDRYDYDALGRISTTDALNQMSYAWFDSQGRIIRTRSNAGADTVYTREFVAAGTPGGIFGAGGRNVGGFKLTTLNADGSSTIDKTDYFGLTTWHQDMGGRQYTYSYDLAGRLSAQTSTAGQHISYKYLQDGLLAEVNDHTLKMRSRYGYDNAGNRTSESYVKLAATGTVPYQASLIQYDELNRMARVWDPNYKSHDLRYEYDAVGNRRAAIAVYWDPLDHAQLHRDDQWYTYDKANRFRVVKGGLVTLSGSRPVSETDTSARIERGNMGMLLTHNGAGQRTSALVRAGNLEEYLYSADGYLEDVIVDKAKGSRRRLDALGRTLQYIEWKPSGELRQKQTSYYDADNRMLRQTVSGTENDGTTWFEYYLSKDSLSSGTTGAFGALASTRFIANKSDSTNVTTTYRYEYWDSAKQKQIVKTASNENAPSWKPGNSSFSYNTNGHLTQVVNGSRTMEYENSAQGLVLRRSDRGSAADYNSYFYYAAGRRIGDVSTDPAARESRISYVELLARDLDAKSEDRYKRVTPVTSVDFDQNYEPINANYPGSIAVRYTVCSGDNLSSIAQAVWGDAAMWYLIAEANGLSANDGLAAGQVLVIPNKVTNIHNNANTFRPYNPGEAIGNVDPTLPDPPPPPRDEGCGMVGQIIMIAVAVVATIYTAGLLAPAAAGAGTGFAATMSAGAGVFAGTSGLGMGAIAVGAAASAVGSVASQLTGMATGNVQEFSWRAVGQAALGGGITAGMATGLNALTQASGMLSGTSVGNWYQTAGNTARAMVNGGLSSATNLALRGDWNWREVAASTVGAGAGHLAGEAVGSVLSGANLGGMGPLVQRSLGSAAGAWASSQVMGDGGAQTRARVTQAFVQGLGSAIGESIASPGVDWRSAPDESAAESARLERSGNRYAGGQQWATDLAARRGGAPVAWPRSSSQPSEDLLGLGDLDAFDATPASIRLGANRWIDAGGTIRNGRVEMGALVERGLYKNTDGDWLQAASTGIAPVGNIDSSNYVLADLPSAYQSKHGAVRAAWDQAGNGFMHVPQANGSYLLLSPPDGYSVPSLASFQLRAAGRGVVDTLAEIPAGLADTALAIGDGYRMTWDALSGGSGIQPWSNLARASLAGQITTSSVLGGIVNMSPVGVLGNAASGDYYAAGRSLGGTGVGLVSGPVGSRIVSSLNKLPVLGTDVGTGIRVGAQWLGSGVAARLDAYMERVGGVMYVAPEGGVVLGSTASVSPGAGFVRFSGDFDTHILNRDFGVPAKRGIGGAHNLDEFMKYSDEFKIVGTVDHPTVDGIQTISYQVAARDPAGKFTGAFRDKVFEKTVFDPSVIPPDTFLTWGRQAAAEGQALGPLNRTWTGTAANGLRFMGYLDDTGAVRSFFPDF